MESPIRIYQKQKDYHRHKLFRKIKRRRERERKNAINAPIKELRRRMKQPVRFRGGKDQDKGNKYGYDVEYMSEAEAMKQLADNMNKSAVMDEVVVTPSRKIPMQAELYEGITNQAANERADEFANRTSLTPGRFLGLMGANIPLAAGALGATVAAPALFDSTIAPLSDYVAGTKAGQAITGLLGNPYFNTAVEATFAGHGLNHAINEGIDGYGDAAMTALEVAPLGKLARPIYEGVVQPGMRLFNSPLTGNWTKIGNKEYRLSPNSLSANGSHLESRAVSPKITAEDAANITPEQWIAAQDAAYKNAVMSGNRKRALELLDEAYKRSGVPETIITMDASGRPKMWYTGSEYGNHTIFDSSKFNATIGGESAVGKIKGNFLTTDLPSAARYAGSDVNKVKEFTEPSTFLEKFQNIFGMYRPERIHPTDRVPEILRPKPDRLFTTKDAPVVDYLDETDNVVYPMYVNPGERVYTVDFKGNPWSRSPVKFLNAYSVKKTVRDDVAKTYRDEIIPFRDRETAVEYYKSLEDRFGKTYVEDPSKLNDKYFPHSGGDRSVEMFASAPSYEKASLIETHTPATTNGAVQTAAREGYTSVYMPNVIDSNVRGASVPYAIDDFVTLKPTQQKIADITYDDNGKLIPLSQRFNWSNMDSRYSWLPWFLGGSTAATLYNKSNEPEFKIGYQKGKDKNLQPPRFQKGTDDNRVQVTERTYPDGSVRYFTGDIELEPVNTMDTDDMSMWTWQEKNRPYITYSGLGAKRNTEEVRQGKNKTAKDKILEFSNKHYADPILGAPARWRESWNNDTNPVKAIINSGIAYGTPYGPAQGIYDLVKSAEAVKTGKGSFLDYLMAVPAVTAINDARKGLRAYKNVTNTTLPDFSGWDIEKIQAYLNSHPESIYSHKLGSLIDYSREGASDIKYAEDRANNFLKNDVYPRFVANTKRPITEEDKALFGANGLPEDVNASYTNLNGSNYGGWYNDNNVVINQAKNSPDNILTHELEHAQRDRLNAYGLLNDFDFADSYVNGYTPSEIRALNNAYNFGDDFTYKLGNIGSINEKGATNRELRYAISSDYGETGKVLDDIIDKMSIEDLKQYLNTTNAYSKDFLKNAGPDFYKNVKEVLKYVPATIGLTVATDSYNRGKDIYIKPSKRGTFTAAAKKRGMSVQQFASKVLKAPKGKYSASMRKKANFAKNASKWKK